MKPQVPFEPTSITLTGRHVQLEPLGVEHAEDLLQVGRDADVWQFLPRPAFGDRNDVVAWIEQARSETKAGRQIAFATLSLPDRRAIGSTRYLDIRREHRGIEIGWTWIGTRHQRTAVNSECKLLLLQHAFEKLGALRVQFKTDARNERSQRAIERIGAVREGTLRNHMLLWDGHVRDSVLYSILDTEWPAAKERLRGFLGRSDRTRSPS